MIVTARQLEDLHRQNGANGHVTLPYRARLSPLRLVSSVSEEEVGRLVPAVRAVLEESIEAGGSSLRDYVRADGQHSEWFWRREFPAAVRWLFGD